MKLLIMAIVIALFASCTNIKETIIPSDNTSTAKPNDNQYLPINYDYTSGKGKGGKSDKSLEKEMTFPQKGYYAKVYGRNKDGDVFWGYSYDCKDKNEAILVARSFCKDAGGSEDQWVFYLGKE